MMQVGHVRVVVRQRLVSMQVGMRFARGFTGPMHVLVVLVMGMKVLVDHPLMGVPVTVPLPEQERRPERHADERRRVHGTYRLVEGDHGGDRAEEGRHREVSGFSRCSDESKRMGVEHHADSVAHASHEKHKGQHSRRRQALAADESDG